MIVNKRCALCRGVTTGVCALGNRGQAQASVAGWQLSSGPSVALSTWAARVGTLPIYTLLLLTHATSANTHRQVFQIHDVGQNCTGLVFSEEV